MKSAARFGLLTLVFLLGSNAMADMTPVIDGDVSEWPTDPSAAFIFQDSADLGWLAHRDIVSIAVTDDNTAGQNGYLYLAIEMAGNFVPDFWGIDIDVSLSFDTNNDGVADQTIEITEGLPTGGSWAYQGNTLEVAIPYSALGLTNGADTFGLAASTSGLVPVADSAPDESSGFIIYDGSVGDGAIEPLSVKIIKQWTMVDARGVSVLWRTGAERNNAGFMVEKWDGNRFGPLLAHAIPGLMDAGFGRSYQVFDRGGLAGDRYRVVDYEIGGLRTVHAEMVAGDGLEPIENTTIDNGPGNLWKQKRGKLIRQRLSALFASARRGRADLVGRRGGGVKIEVDQSGLQYVPFDDLQDGGFPKRFLQRGLVSLWRQGRRVPVAVKENGIYFYAPLEMTRTADYNIYVAKPGRPLPFYRQSARPKRRGGEVSQFTRTIKVEENAIYNVAARQDPFFMSAAYDGWPAAVTIDGTDWDLDRPVRLKVTMAGYATALGPDHKVEIGLNGQVLGQFSWNGFDRFVADAVVPAGLLKPVGNQVTVTLVNAPVIDVVWIDKVALVGMAPLSFEAQQEEGFAVGDVGTVAVTGVPTDESLWLLDVTDGERPILLRRWMVDKDRVLRFANARRGWKAAERRYLLASSQAAARPMVDGPLARLEWSPGSVENLDQLIITHPAFADAAWRLAAFRQREGAQVMVVTTDGIYDEFNYGEKDPAAITRFIDQLIKSGATALSRVLLVGAATVDPAGYLGLGDEDYLPALFHHTLANHYEAAADWLYVANHPGLAIGRLPVESVEEAALVVDKIIAAAERTRTGRALFIADRDGGAVSYGEGFFEQVAEGEIALLPDGVSPTRLYRNFTQTAVPDMEAALNDGVDLVVYNGHAYLSGWSQSPQLATVASAGALQNENPFVLLSFSCFDGAFTGPWDDSLAYAFVRNPHGGAVAALAGASLSAPGAVDRFAQEIIWQLASGAAPDMGSALARARAALLPTADASLKDALITFNLLGDPATPNPVLSSF